MSKKKVKKAAKKTIAKTVKKKAAKKTAKKALKKAAKKTPAAPLGKPVKKAAKKVIKKAIVKKAVKKVAKKTIKKAVKKAVVKPVKKALPVKAAPKKAVKKAAPPAATGVRAVTAATRGGGAALPETMMAVLTVDIRNTNPGLSTVTATSDTASQTVNSSGTITLHHIKHGEIIVITGRSLGNTTITINLSTDPAQLDFPPGQLQGSFFIN